MSLMLTDEDVVLEQLAEIAPPCVAYTEEEGDCPRPAKWVASWTCGCRDLICDEHLAGVTAELGQVVWCDDGHDCFTKLIRWEWI